MIYYIHRTHLDTDHIRGPSNTSMNKGDRGPRTWEWGYYPNLIMVNVYMIEGIACSFIVLVLQRTFTKKYRIQINDFDECWIPEKKQLWHPLPSKPLIYVFVKFLSIRFVQIALLIWRYL